ncbi:MAG TPA: glycosyltransferase family 2 protein [Methanosarcinales archaeon]|nr:glycosyltransferase family 2 protein [Methanosarcinales archaeon]
MKIETFTFCYNEEKMLPYFLRHYSQYGSITIFDNQSTDNSVNIAKQFGANIIEFNTDNKYREDIITNLRNDCWKGSGADWVIIADIDEIVYHKRLELALARAKGTVILPHMFEMFSDVFPVTTGQIYDEVNMGIELRSKMFLFRPDKIRNINYEPGCHFARPEGDYVLDAKSEIIAMHFKYLSLAYTTERYDELNYRQSEENIANNWSWHMNKTPEQVDDNFKDANTRLMKIL